MIDVFIDELDLRALEVRGHRPGRDVLSGPLGITCHMATRLVGVM
jgi:hypothetical protein